jgi:hypothetical protein
MSTPTLTIFRNGYGMGYGDHGYYVIDNCPVRYDLNVRLGTALDMQRKNVGPTACQTCLDKGCLRGVFVALCDDCSRHYIYPSNMRCECYNDTIDEYGLEIGLDGVADRMLCCIAPCAHENCILKQYYRYVPSYWIGCKDHIEYKLHTLNGKRSVSSHIRFIDDDEYHDTADYESIGYDSWS